MHMGFGHADVSQNCTCTHSCPCACKQLKNGRCNMAGKLQLVTHAHAPAYAPAMLTRPPLRQHWISSFRISEGLVSA